MSLFDIILSLLGFRGRESQQQTVPRPLPVDRITVLERLDSSPFGLNSHVAPPKYLHKFADIGLRWHRIDIDWDRIETEEGKYDWSEVDAVVGAASERSLSLLGVIAYTPAWAAVDPNEPAKTSRTKMPSDPSGTSLSSRPLSPGTAVTSKPSPSGMSRISRSSTLAPEVTTSAGFWCRRWRRYGPMHRKSSVSVPTFQVRRVANRTNGWARSWIRPETSWM